MRCVLMIIVGALFSLYYFPISLKVLPTFNSKMMLAVLGILLLVYNMLRSSFKGDVPKYIITIYCYAIIVSLIALFSTVYNNTPDYVYATYVVSMSVWLSAAYAVCDIVNKLHGKLNLTLITNYLIAVCVFQCVIALIIDSYPIVKSFINTYIEHNQTFLDRSNVRRMYGIGAALDTAGIRFSIVLVLIAHQLTKTFTGANHMRVIVYWLSFLLISVVGNMMARTTTVGMLLAFIYIVYYSFTSTKRHTQIDGYVWSSFFIVAILVILMIIPIYMRSPEFASKIRFGFEGFFNLLESGQWNVGSNNQLLNMLVFPEKIKTWIIGDGYFNNPNDINPQYYLGEVTGGYYMGTDVGYLRFIFYFGLIGLGAFVAFFVKLTQICNELLESQKPLFGFILILGLCVWLKVSTDIFVIYAIFIVVCSRSPEGLYNEQH